MRAAAGGDHAPDGWSPGPADRVLVTGAAGFIGSAVTRQLVARGADVVALVEPGSPSPNLDGLDVERVEADVRDRASVERAATGCSGVFHVAALYRFWAPDPGDFYSVNVDGTRNVLAAAGAAGVRRVVYTSTVGTIGLRGAALERPADETSYAEVDHLFGRYKQSKYVAEHEVLRAAAEGLPVVLVLPTTPVGPGDRGPTPTGRTVVDFLNGRMPAYVDTTLNIVDVDDVAAAHLAAAERGRQGRSYIVGGENMALRDVLAALGAATGLPVPTRQVPRQVALAAAHLSGLIEDRLLGRPPSVPLEGARMSTTHMAFDDRRARDELGHRSRPPAEALARAARWFAEHGYVRPERLAKMTWGHAMADAARGA